MGPNVTNVVELGTLLVSALGDQDMFIEGKTHISKKGRIVIGDFRPVEIYENLGLPLSTITFTVDSHAGVVPEVDQEIAAIEEKGVVLTVHGTMDGIDTGHALENASDIVPHLHMTGRGETVDHKVESVEEMATIGRSSTMTMFSNLMFLRNKQRDKHFRSTLKYWDIENTGSDRAFEQERICIVY